MSHLSFAPSFAVRTRSRRALVAALPAALLVAACSKEGPTETREPLAVTAALANMTGPAIFDATPLTPTLVRCAIQLRLDAQGTGRSRFSGGAIYRYAGANRATPTDSLVLTPTQLQQAFAATAIVPGVSMLAAWTVDDSIPFATRVVVRHRVEGRGADESLAVDAPCGPTPQGSGPEVSDVTIHAATPGLEPGDTAVVRFRAASTTGLWRTRVEVTGPCTVRSATIQALETSAQLELRIALPATCARGLPLQVRVTAVDAALRERSASIAGPALVDATPPSLLIDGALVAGDIFAPDTLVRSVVALDDVALGWVRWEWVGTGLRDSVAARGTRTTVALRIPLPATLPNRPQLRVTVIDSVGNASAGHTSVAGSVRVLPTLERPITSVTIPGELRGLLLDERRGHILVLQGVARRVLVLDRTTLATVRTIALPDLTHRMELTAGGDSLIFAFATPALLGIADLRAAAPVVTTLAMTGIDTLPGRMPAQLAATSRGTVMVITAASNGLSDARLVETTLATGATRVWRGVDVAGGFTLISRSPDASVVAFARIGCLRRWTAATDAFDACRMLVGDDLVTWSADGRMASLSRLLLNADFGLRLTAEAPNNAAFPKTQLSADGALLLIRMDGLGVARSRTSDGVLVDRLRMPAHVIQAWSDGSAIVTATGYQEGTTRVYVTDPR